MKETEIFSSIRGYEGFYEISSFGIVRSVSRTITYKDGRTFKYSSHIISHGDNGNGYHFVHLWKNNKSKRFYVHRLVAEAFIPNPKNLPIVNHKDENKGNNVKSNLEWCTCKENVNYGTAIQRQIKKQGFPVKLIDEIGVERNFLSIAQAAKFLHVPKGNATHAYHSGLLLCGMRIVDE